MQCLKVDIPAPTKKKLVTFANFGFAQSRHGSWFFHKSISLEAMWIRISFGIVVHGKDIGTNDCIFRYQVSTTYHLTEQSEKETVEKS